MKVRINAVPLLGYYLEERKKGIRYNEITLLLYPHSTSICIYAFMPFSS